jgi:predicted RNA binding protein YcfA (HicA-like mRNA interferase family)
LPDIPAYGEGATEDEAIDDLKEAIRGYIESFGLDDAISRISQPARRTEPSGTVPIFRSPRGKMGLSPFLTRFWDKLLVASHHKPRNCGFLQRQGLQLLRVRGSHHFFTMDELRTSVPVHGNRPLKIGTLRGILRDIQMTPTEFARRTNRES